MKQIIFTLAASALAGMALCSCKVQTTEELGEIQTKNIHVEHFTNIVNNGSANVHYVPSNTYEVTVSAPEKIMPYITVSAKDGVLSISQDEDEWRNSNNYVIYNGRGSSVEVWVKAPSFNAVNLLGSGDFDMKGRLAATDFSAYTSGSGDIDLDSINATGTLKVQTLGSGDIKLGKYLQAQTVELTSSGSGDIRAERLSARTISAKTLGSGDFVGIFVKAQAVNLSTAGSGDIRVEAVQCGDITGSSLGSGDISVSGTAASCNLNATGSGEVSNVGTVSPKVH